MIDYELEGRVALVTGAWRGIGRAIVRCLIAQGARVAINVRDPERAAAAAEAEGVNALAVPGDVTESASVESMVTATLERWGRLDILVNNAAYATGTRLPGLEELEWKRAIDVNLTGAFLCLKAAMVPMRAARFGRIINISSTAGKTVSTLAGAHYTASKHGLLGLTKAAARELGPEGITVNAICPGMTDTDLVRETASPELVREVIDTRVPIRRFGTPDEVAELVCFVASPRSGYVNGASLDINGGIVMV